MLLISTVKQCYPGDMGQVRRRSLTTRAWISIALGCAACVVLRCGSSPHQDAAILPEHAQPAFNIASLKRFGLRIFYACKGAKESGAEFGDQFLK